MLREMARKYRNVLCFVSIFISRNPFVKAISNVAVEKPAFQSSTWEHDNALYGAWRVVDGSTDTCMHTNSEANCFWEVDLGAVYFIDHVDVHNRFACCYRMENVQVFVGFVQSDYALFSYLPGLLGSQHTFQMDAHTYGRWVRISRKDVFEVFLICEVQIYGELLIADVNVRFEQLQNKTGIGTVLGVFLGISKVECAVRCKTLNECVGFNFDAFNLECTTLGATNTNNNYQDNMFFYRKG